MHFFKTFVWFFMEEIKSGQFASMFFRVLLLPLLQTLFVSFIISLSFFIFLYLYSCILDVSFFQRLPFNNQTQLLLSEINLVALCKEGAFSLLNVTFELTEKGLDAVEEIGSGKPLWRGEKMSM